MSVQRIIPAYDGIDADAAQDYIAQTKAPLVRNFLVDRKGQLQMRGPLNQSRKIYDEAKFPTGIWTWNDKALIGSGTAGTFSRYGIDGGTVDDSLYHVDLRTSALNRVTGATSDISVSTRFTRLGDYVWGKSFSGTSSKTINGVTVKSYGLLRWDGTAALPTAYSNAPFYFQDLRGHAQRLFVLGGTPASSPSGTPAPSALYFSDLGGPGSDAASAWQDDVTGLLNEIIVETDDQNDTGVGLAKVGTNLAIFKRKSIHVLYGSGPTNFAVRQFSANTGCLTADSIVEVDDGCYFLSDAGYMFFDGAQLQRVSNGMVSTLLTAALRLIGGGGTGDPTAGPQGGRVVSGRLDNGYVALTVVDASNVVKFSGWYHGPSNSWTTFSSGVMASSAPVLYAHALDTTLGFDTKRLWKLNTAVVPEVSDDDKRGFDTDGTNKARIPARWESRLYPLATPWSRCQLSRFIMDYSFSVDGAADGASNGWYVTIVGGDGTVLLSERQVPAQGDPGTYTFRRRYSADVFSEAADAQVIIEWRDLPSDNTYPALVKAEIYDCGIEFEPSFRRGSS